MKKRFILLLSLAVFFSLGLSLTLSAQDYYKENKAPETKAGFKLPLGEIFSFVKNIFASAQNSIGIDLGSSAIKIAQLQKGAKGYTITNYITRSLPRNIKDNPEEKKRLVK